MENGPVPAESMNEETRRLFDAALAVQAHAHVPYSNYPVGCALISSNGTMYVGANIENAAYPQGWCAEASAIAAMASAGEREIAVLLTICDSEELATCCGGCRQKIREFATASTRVLACGPDGLQKTYSMDELLPDSFGPEHLT